MMHHVALSQGEKQRLHWLLQLGDKIELAKSGNGKMQLMEERWIEADEEAWQVIAKVMAK